MNNDNTTNNSPVIDALALYFVQSGDLQLKDLKKPIQVVKTAEMSEVEA
jgi:hypothetical protein